MTFKFNLDHLDGSNGFVINGIDPFDHSGWSVSDAGDVNGDGYDDLIIGAPLADASGKSSTGESYVVFGKAGGFDSSVQLSSLNGTDGFVINGIVAFDLSGFSVSGAGDVNGDGYDDLIIGAYKAAPHGNDRSGQTYVIFGRSGGFDSLINLSSLDSRNGFILNGIDAGDYSAWSVSGAGDVNGDGFDDLIIGAKNADANGVYRAGQSYVVFGKAGSFDPILELSSLNGSNGFIINGIERGDSAGYSVSSAGDVNGDGYDDLIIGAFLASPNGTINTGASYVVFGKAGGFSANLELSSLDGSNGFVLNGSIESLLSCGSVSGAGDVNGDGLDDLIIGAHWVEVDGNFAAGQSYVVFGKTSYFNASLDLSSLNGSNGFILNGINARDYSGQSVSNAGDINGDGYDDVIIGAPRANPNGTGDGGESYVVFGKASGFDAIIELSSLDGHNGILLNGVDQFDNSGFSVSGAGDVNGDGFDDLIIGAKWADPNDNRYAGESYVVFGRANFIDQVLRGTTWNDQLIGDLGNDTIFGRDGDDTLIGGHGRDSIKGHDGDDTLIGNQNADTLRGGSGDDVLYSNDGADRLIGDGGDDTMTGGNGADRFIFRAEQISDGVIDHDLITDYDPLKDRIELKSGVAVEDHDIFGGNLILTFTGGDQVELQGITNFADVVFV